MRGEVFRGRFSGCVKFEVGSLPAGRSGSWTGGEVVCQLARRDPAPSLEFANFKLREAWEGAGERARGGGWCRAGVTACTP